MLGFRTHSTRLGWGTWRPQTKGASRGPLQAWRALSASPTLKVVRDTLRLSVCVRGKRSVWVNRNTQGPGKTGGTTSTPLHSTRSLEPWRPRKLWLRGGGLRAASETESRLTPTPSPVIQLHGSSGGLLTCHPIGLTHSGSSVNRRDRETRTRSATSSPPPVAAPASCRHTYPHTDGPPVWIGLILLTRVTPTDCLLGNSLLLGGGDGGAIRLNLRSKLQLLCHQE